jgi:hypothetical protein
MPAFGESLSEEELLAVVRYEREILGGETESVLASGEGAPELGAEGAESGEGGEGEQGAEAEAAGGDVGAEGEAGAGAVEGSPGGPD